MWFEYNPQINFSSAVHESSTTLRSNEKCTFVGKGCNWSQIKAYHLFFHLLVVVVSGKCSVIL